MRIFLDVSESRKKKKKKGKNSRKASDRSKYLKMLFGIMKGELGDGLIRTYITGDKEKFKEYWTKFTDEILKAATKNGDDSGGKADEEGEDNDGKESKEASSKK